MDTDPEQIASDWIIYSRYSPNSAPEDVFDRGWSIYELAFETPLLAWEAIKSVIRRYSEDQLFTEDDTEAKRILGHTAAGPLEDLLAEHGTSIIDAVEAEAKRDRRMFWTLGGVWQNSMADDIWLRVQQAAGGISR